MKRHDAIEAIQKAFRRLSPRKAGGVIRVGFVSFGPMLYVDVPSSVRLWEELRQQLLLVPELNRELKSRERS